MKEIKVGIVGLGRLGSVHAQNLAFKIPGCKLVAACSLEQKELDWAKDYLKVEYTTTDYKKMVDEADIEAVVIVSSSPEHCWMIEYALDAGKHVFTDKPLGCSLEECKRAEAAVERHPDKIFFLGFMRRYDPSYADAKAQINAGRIGKPYLVKATGLDPEALVESCIKFSKTSGGIFIDAASHDIDLMRWFLGGEVTEVYAAGTNFKHPEFAENGDTETGMAMLKFDNGTVAFLHVGRTAPHGYHTETEIVGTEAHIRVAGVPWKDRVMVYDQYGARQEIVENFPQRFAEAYLLEMVDFIDCIQKDSKPELTVYDGTKATPRYLRDYGFVPLRQAGSGTVLIYCKIAQKQSRKALLFLAYFHLLCYYNGKEVEIMNNNIPIARWLSMFWLCSAVSLVLGQFSGPVTLNGTNGAALTVTGILGIFCTLVQFYPFYRFSRVSERLQRAFTATVLSVAATVVGLLALTLVPSDTPPYTPSTFYLLFSLIALAGVIAAYVSQFWLYTGLDDVCTERGYDFPPKRIRWCFYLSLINILLRMLPTSIPIFLSQIASLVLLALFIRAAYQAEKLTV